MPHKVFIYGSCVSRDAAELFDPSRHQLVSYYARSAVGSAFSPRVVADAYSDRLTSKFQRNQVRNDFAKNLPRALTSTEFDTLLVDFTDERFSLFEFHTGEVVTVSVELNSLHVLSPEMGRTIKAYSEEHLARWKAGWKTLVDLAKREQFLDKIVVNRAFWAFADISGSPIENVNPDSIRRANRYFGKLYNECARDLPAGQFIDYTTAVTRSDPTHRWGHAPFHYCKGFYETTLQYLDERRRCSQTLPL